MRKRLDWKDEDEVWEGREVVQPIFLFVRIGMEWIGSWSEDVDVVVDVGRSGLVLLRWRIERGNVSMVLRCRYLCVSGSLAIVLGVCIMHFVS